MKTFGFGLTRGTMSVLSLAAFCGMASARDLVWTGDKSSDWDLTSLNWRVAGDA